MRRHCNKRASSAHLIWSLHGLRNCGTTAGLDGISAEINVGSLLTHEQVMRSLQLYCQDVMPRFK